MPSIDVDFVDGLIEKSPLQVAGALMLPAAVFLCISLSASFSFLIRGTYNRRQRMSRARSILPARQLHQKNSPMGFDIDHLGG